MRGCGGAARRMHRVRTRRRAGNSTWARLTHSVATPPLARPPCSSRSPATRHPRHTRGGRAAWVGACSAFPAGAARGAGAPGRWGAAQGVPYLDGSGGGARVASWRQRARPNLYGQHTIGRKSRVSETTTWSREKGEIEPALRLCGSNSNPAVAKGAGGRGGGKRGTESRAAGSCRRRGAFPRLTDPKAHAGLTGGAPGSSVLAATGTQAPAANCQRT